MKLKLFTFLALAMFLVSCGSNPSKSESAKKEVTTKVAEEKHNCKDCDSTKKAECKHDADGEKHNCKHDADSTAHKCNKGEKHECKNECKKETK